MEDKTPYKKLLVWVRSYELVLEVYRVTKNFPKEERYGITSQLQRSAVSVSANIVEGHAKPSRKELLRFLGIAKGSLTECKFLLELSRDLGYLDAKDFEKLDIIARKTGFLLHRFATSMLAESSTSLPYSPYSSYTP